MKVSFEYDKQEYKKYLIRSRKVNNIFLFIILTGIYCFFFLNKFDLIFFPVALICILIIIVLINLLYVAAYLKVNEMLNYNTYGKYILELTINKFSLTINNSKIDYKYNKIKKLVEHKNSFVIKLKGTRETLTFEKFKLKESDYNKVIKMFKERID